MQLWIKMKKITSTTTDHFSKFPYYFTPYITTPTFTTRTYALKAATHVGCNFYYSLEAIAFGNKTVSIRHAHTSVATLPNFNLQFWENKNWIFRKLVETWQITKRVKVHPKLGTEYYNVERPEVLFWINE